MSHDNVILLNSENFKAEVLNETIPVVVDFYADRCSPCKMLEPIVDELAGEFLEKVKFCKVNVDQQRKLAIQLKVMSIPTILFYKNGRQVNREAGVLSKNGFLNIINEML